MDILVGKLSPLLVKVAPSLLFYLFWILIRVYDSLYTLKGWTKSRLRAAKVVKNNQDKNARRHSKWVSMFFESHHDAIWSQLSKLIAQARDKKVAR